ncbi:MAG: 4Fe-4S binding protein [Clostridia bacterium]|nr:4Fe-4S binding protein [Clostridia bacterium]
MNQEMIAVKVPCSARPIAFNAEKCVGCNRCVNICQVDIMLPNPEKGKPPVVVYPGECYYCGCCVMVCPREGAISLEHPIMNRAKFVPVKRPEGEGAC